MHGPAARCRRFFIQKVSRLFRAAVDGCDKGHKSELKKQLESNSELQTKSWLHPKLAAAAAIATILVMTALSAVIHPDGHAVAKVALKRAGNAMPHTTFLPNGRLFRVQTPSPLCSTQATSVHIAPE